MKYLEHMFEKIKIKKRNDIFFMKRTLSKTSFMDFSTFQQMQGGPSPDMSDVYRDPMFNPMAQYEQAYLYYRYLCMQMDYKIKCKEYEKLCDKSQQNERSQRKLE